MIGRRHADGTPRKQSRKRGRKLVEVEACDLVQSSSLTLRRASILLAESGIASTRPDQSVNLMKRIGVPFEAPCRTHWHWWG